MLAALVPVLARAEEPAATLALAERGPLRELPEWFAGSGRPSRQVACTGPGDDRRALAAADQGGSLAIPPGVTCTVGADLTIASDVVFGFGATLHLPGGVTVTLAGDVAAPATQRIFSGPGKAVLHGQRSEVKAEWWGARADGATLSTDAFQAAHDACVNGCMIRASAGRYLLDGLKPVAFARRGVSLCGQGVGATIFGPNVNGETPLLTFAGEQVRICDFQINPMELAPAPSPGTLPSNGWTTNGIWLLPGFGGPAQLERLYIANTRRALWAQAGTDVHIGRARILNCTICLQTGGVPNYHFAQSHIEHVSLNPGSGALTEPVALLLETNTISNTFLTLEIAGGGAGIQVQSTIEASPSWTPNMVLTAGEHRYHGNIVYKALTAGTTSAATPPAGAIGTMSPAPGQPGADGTVRWLAVTAHDTSVTRPGNNWIRHSNIDFGQLAAVRVSSATYLEIATSTMSGVQRGPGLLIEVPDGKPSNEVDGVLVKDSLLAGNATHGAQWNAGTNLTIRNSQVYANSHAAAGRYANVLVGAEARGLFEFTNNLCGFNAAGSAAGWGNNMTTASHCLSFARGALRDWAPWAPNTAYGQGDVRKNTYGVYRATRAGISASAGGPTGYGAAVADGTVIWSFTEPAAAGALNVQGNTMLRNSVGAIEDGGHGVQPGNRLIRNNLGAADVP